MLLKPWQCFPHAPAQEGTLGRGWHWGRALAPPHHGDPGTGVDATGLFPLEALSASLTSLKE